MTTATTSEHLPPTCILTGAEGENPDDCTTHDHEPPEAATATTSTTCERCGQALSHTSPFGSRGALRCPCCDESNDCDHTQPPEAATPRPWRVGGHPRDNSGSSWREILTDSLPYAPSYVAQALEPDAELIVRAVNAHDGLVAALTGLLKEVDAHLDYERDRDMERWADKAREALKLARGE